MCALCIGAAAFSSKVPVRTPGWGQIERPLIKTDRSNPPSRTQDDGAPASSRSRSPELSAIRAPIKRRAASLLGSSSGVDNLLFPGLTSLSVKQEPKSIKVLLAFAAKNTCYILKGKYIVSLTYIKAAKRREGGERSIYT